MSKISNRIKEPTTWMGVALTITGLGQLFKVKEAPEIAETVATAGDSFVNGDSAGGIALLIAGVLGMFMREKDERVDVLSPTR